MKRGLFITIGGAALLIAGSLSVVAQAVIGNGTRHPVRSRRPDTTG